MSQEASIGSSALPFPHSDTELSGARGRAIGSWARQLLRVVVGVLLIAGGLLPRSGAALVHFIGQDRTHVWCLYEYISGGPHHAMVLGVERPDGSEETLAVSSTKTLEYKGVDAGLAPGEHRYWLRRQATENGPWELLDEGNVMIDGKTVGGTLVFGESISRDAVVDTRFDLTVPEGKTLTVGAVRLTGGRLKVNGNLILTQGTRVDLLVEVFAPNQLSGFSGGTFWFRPGAEGSVIEGGLDFSASFPYTDFLIEGCSNAVVTVQQRFMNLSGTGFQNVELRLAGQDATLSGLTNVVLDTTRLTGELEVSRSHLKGWVAGQPTITRLEKVVVAAGAAFAAPTEILASTFHGHVTINRSAFEATDSRFASMELMLAPPGKVRLTRSWFSQGVRIAGGAPSFEGCEFGASVTLVNRSGTRIRRSHFLEEIWFANEDRTELRPRWFDPRSGATDWQEPIIELNSFMGRWALRYPSADTVPEARSIPIADIS